MLTPPHTPTSGAPGQRPTGVVETVVVGDGTTAVSRARSRWRRVRWPLGLLVGIVLVAVLAALIRPPTSEVPLAPDNPSPLGSRALAEILKDQGVRITYVRTSAEAVAAAREGTTLLVIGSHLLDSAQVDALAATAADLVLAEPESWSVRRLTDDALRTAAGYEADGEADAARCDDPDAQAAEAIESDGFGLRADSPDVVVCFPQDPADPETGGYAVLAGERRVVAFDDASLMTNDRLDEHGHAALLLRSLGRHDRLTWYIASAGDRRTDASAGAGQLLPGWTGPLSAQLVLLLLVVALWRGRALGRIVTEPLPVTVRASETALGRGRLYRRSRSHGHAAAALRAGTARRAAARLGLPRSAGAIDVIDALARATGRSTEQVAGLLYGPPPTDDAALLGLARQLDDLESEVHRT